MKLTTRYYRHIIPAILIIFLASIVCSYFLIRRALQWELDKILLRSKHKIETYVKDNNRIPDINSLDDQIVFFKKTPHLLSDVVFSSSTQYIPEQNKYHLSRRLLFTIMIGNKPWEVTISQPLEGTRHLTILVVAVAIVTISVTLLILMLIYRRVLSRIWSPFHQSLALIKTFKVNDTVYPEFPDSYIDEFKLLNTHFRKAAENAMRDYRNLKEFSENASHELQTPLAIIRSNLDLLAQENMTEKQSELLQSVYSSVRKLSRLQASLLLLTKIDNRQFGPVHDIRIDLALRDKIQQIQELLHTKNLHCDFELTETYIPANKELLEILLNNLFSNAISHNVMNGNIHAALEKKSLTISNTGVDQPLDHERVFRRFYKSSPKNDSNGLGLSIIKQICDTTALQVQYVFRDGRHYFTVCW